MVVRPQGRDRIRDLVLVRILARIPVRALVLARIPVRALVLARIPVRALVLDRILARARVLVRIQVRDRTQTGITANGPTIGTIPGTTGRPPGGRRVSGPGPVSRRPSALVLGLLALLQPLLRRRQHSRRRWHHNRLFGTVGDGGPVCRQCEFSGGHRPGDRIAGRRAQRLPAGRLHRCAAQCDKAIALQPNDPLLHEFRGLALFALQRYDEAAGAIYAVLSAGPGWDWTTLSGLYPDVSLYTEQLRTLERYVTLHPASTAAKFLLAYHYTTCGYNDAAAAQLKAVVQLDPKDQLSAQLLSLLKPNSVAPQPVQSVAGRPAEAAALVGNWIADRGDGETIALSLTKDGQYTWKLDQHGKVQQFSGPYTVADSLLVLKKGQTPVMIGQASLLANDRFNFKLPGDNPSDPGLTFGR